MGGAISVESRPGEGSCFRFTIRAGVPVEPAIRTHADAGPRSRKQTARARALRVLVAEDNVVNQRLAVKSWRSRDTWSRWRATAEKPSRP